MTTETQTARDQLVKDFKQVISDAEDLLKATAHDTSAKVGAVRERAEENIRKARAKLEVLEDDVIMQTKAAAKATNQMVQENPWQAMAIAAGIGLLIGIVSSRR